MDELKNRIENEIIKLDGLYEKINEEASKYYELQREQLIKEENELKDKLKNEVTKMKEKLEIKISEINDILRNYERTMKFVEIYKKEENKILKTLNYISNMNKSQKEMIEFSQQLIKNLDISFDDHKIEYKEYYFNGLPVPKDIRYKDININSIKISWKIDESNFINLDNKEMKYAIQIRKENEKFKQIYEGNNNSYIIKNLYYDTDYDIRICSIYNNIISNYTEIYKIKTDDIDSIILKKNKRRKEFFDIILSWCGFKSMNLLYRGTRDGMTIFNFHNKCDNKGKTICLFLNDKGNIFGGYSSIPWSSDGGSKVANNCFLFTLTNIYNTEPIKFPHIKESSVYHGNNYGPEFGGNDLFFNNYFTDKESIGSKFPSSYYDILGKGRTIFTGDYNQENKYIILKEIEIFELY